MLNTREYICIDPDWEAYNAPPRYDTEDDYLDALYCARDIADEKAREAAESTAELFLFDTDEERKALIEEVYKEVYEEEYARLCEERGI